MFWQLIIFNLIFMFLLWYLSSLTLFVFLNANFFSVRQILPAFAEGRRFSVVLDDKKPL